MGWGASGDEELKRNVKDILRFLKELKQDESRDERLLHDLREAVGRLDKKAQMEDREMNKMEQLLKLVEHENQSLREQLQGIQSQLREIERRLAA